MIGRTTPPEQNEHFFCKTFYLVFNFCVSKSFFLVKLFLSTRRGDQKKVAVDYTTGAMIITGLVRNFMPLEDIQMAFEPETVALLSTFCVFVRHSCACKGDVIPLNHEPRICLTLKVLYKDCPRFCFCIIRR